MECQDLDGRLLVFEDSIEAAGASDASLTSKISNYLFIGVRRSV
jgi:hypothetical protein